MANVAARPSLSGEIIVVLRDGAFVHGGAEIRRVGQVLGQCVIRQKAEAVGILSADVHVSGVVPTLRRVFEQVNGANRKRLALDYGVSAAGSEHCAGYEAQCVEWTARSEWSRTGRRIVDQV